MENDNQLKKILTEGIREFGSELDEQQIGQFMKYKDVLLEWNKKINLTAIEDEEEIYIKHFLDSLSVLPYIKNEKIKIIDIGTGAGFPGIPLKIVYKNINVVLLDSLDKRIKFLKETIGLLKLHDISAFHGRAEDYAIIKEYREKFDLSVARAVASLPVLLEYCLPYVKVGGKFIAMKGSSTDEIEASRNALDVLGGEIESIKEIILPFSDIKRNIIIVRKLRQTPPKFPRKAGKPSKEPL